MNDHDLYISTLKAKYLSAVKDYRTAINALRDADRRKSIYAETLKEEGQELPKAEDGYVVGTGNTVLGVLPLGFEKEKTNGQKETPLSANHALHILMKKHGNVGFTFSELKKYSDEEGFGMSEEEIRKAFWRQMTKKLAERMPNGKVRLTEEGLKFDRFRVQKIG